MKPVVDAVVLTDLPWEWRSKAELFRDHEEVSLAIAYETCAAALEEALASEGDVALTLRQAAEESGYSADHLGRLIRDGKIPNAGRPGAPRIARGDLPIKSHSTVLGVAEATPVGDTSLEQIVQSIIKEGVG